jgi:hypothetical protein
LDLAFQCHAPALVHIRGASAQRYGEFEEGEIDQGECVPTLQLPDPLARERAGMPAALAKAKLAPLPRHARATPDEAGPFLRDDFVDLAAIGERDSGDGWRHGRHDQRIDPDQHPSIDTRPAAQLRCGVHTEAVTNAVHGFANPNADRQNLAALEYHRPTDERSWRAMRDLFDETF